MDVPADPLAASGALTPEARHRRGAELQCRLSVQENPPTLALLVGCGISGGARPPRLTPPAKKPRPSRPATTSHPQPTGPPPAVLPRSMAPPPGNGPRDRQEESSRRPNVVLFPSGQLPCDPHASNHFDNRGRQGYN
jgi:hypothetical protein